MMMITMMIYNNSYKNEEVNIRFKQQNNQQLQLKNCNKTVNYCRHNLKCSSMTTRSCDKE